MIKYKGAIIQLFELFINVSTAQNYRRLLSEIVMIFPDPSKKNGKLLDMILTHMLPCMDSNTVRHNPKS
jgi:hypothetical protein